MLIDWNSQLKKLNFFWPFIKTLKSTKTNNFLYFKKKIF